MMTGPELKHWRETHALTQTRLAAALGITYTTLWRWETGQRPVPPFLELALETLERRQRKALRKPTRGAAA